MKIFKENESILREGKAQPKQIENLRNMKIFKENESILREGNRWLI